jgi:hypothetical protein
VSPPDAAGWTQGDAVQACAQLAILRDNAAAWRLQRIAAFEEGGGYRVRPLYVRTRTAIGRAEVGQIASALFTEGLGGFYRYGDAPFYAPAVEPGAGLDDDWSYQLARAADRVLVLVGDAKHGPEAPARAQLGAVFVLGPAMPVAIIVAGAALAVIGVTAAWRYLDPETAKAALVVRAAAEAYTERLSLWEETGTMPPPSALELAAADTVQRLAKERGSSALWFGLSVAGGLTAGTLAAAAISRAVSK